MLKKHFLHRIEDFEWIPGAVEALQQLKAAGFLLMVVTNQSGVARGHFSEDDVTALHRHMQRELEASDTTIDAYYYCPYHPEATLPAYRLDAACRKPKTGMLTQAIDEWHVDPRVSFLVGDRERDIEAGRRLGLTTILVETGYGAREKTSTNANHVEPDILAAAQCIMRLSGSTLKR